jgi:hypothetical protein
MKSKGLLFLLSTFVATAASAGATSNHEVLLSSNTVNGFAQGAFVAARNSADTRQYIACSLSMTYEAGASTSSRTLQCRAMDAAGNYAWCYTNAPSYLQPMVDLITSLRDTDILGFSWNLSTQVCRQITVERTSRQAPSGGTTALTTTRTEAPTAGPVADAEAQK